ncbi:MAG: hypothetical protein ACRDOJ_02710 [Nocardioidaceae bacterium]
MTAEHDHDPLTRALLPVGICTLAATALNTWWVASLAAGGDRNDLVAATTVMGATMATIFAYGLSAGLLAWRLRPLLWGYVPGLAAVLVTGLLISAVPGRGPLSAAAVAADSWVLLDPLLWASFVLLALAWRRWQRLRGVRSAAPTSGGLPPSTRSRTAP